MNKLKAVIDLFLAGLLAATLYAQAPARPSPPTSSEGSVPAPAKTTSSSPEKVVLKVGNEQVTQAEFDSLIGGQNPANERAVATQGRKRLGEQYATMLLLSQQAVSEHLDSSPDVRRQMTLQRLQVLANAEYANLSRQAKPKPEEISQYYAAHPAEFEEAQIRKVFIRKSPEGAKEGTPGLSPQEAKTRADALRKALAAGTDPKKVTEDFKNKDVLIDAEPRTVRRAQLPAELDKAAFELKEGAVSDLQETPQAINFIQVVKRRRRELQEVTPQIERKLQQQNVQTALADLKKKAAVWMDDEYFATPPAPLPASTALPGGHPASAAPSAPSPAPATQKPAAKLPPKP